MASLELDVFLEGMTAPAGRLARADDGAITFRYITDGLPHPLSLSLPVREEPYGDSLSRGFFSNLLFENAQREQVMQRHGIDFSDVVGLLAYLGADCPGSISCVPIGRGPAKVPGNLEADYESLSDDDLRRIMRSLRDFRRVPDDTGDPSPLAGVQGIRALNRDHHLKNHAFLMDRAGSWSPAPAYDLSFSAGPGGEHTLRSQAKDGDRVGRISARCRQSRGTDRSGRWKSSERLTRPLQIGPTSPVSRKFRRACGARSRPQWPPRPAGRNLGARLTRCRRFSLICSNENVLA